jgi:hypothetical protein
LPPAAGSNLGGGDLTIGRFLKNSIFKDPLVLDPDRLADRPGTEKKTRPGQELISGPGPETRTRTRKKKPDPVMNLFQGPDPRPEPETRTRTRKKKSDPVKNLFQDPRPEPEARPETRTRGPEQSWKFFGFGRV